MTNISMDPAQVAAALDGNEYGSEGSKDLFLAMKAAGLVAVFGASDDLIEFRGAIDDEDGVFGGGQVSLTREGLLRSQCECDDCPYFKKIEAAAPVVEALWGEDDFSWSYNLVAPDGSTISHHKFVIQEADQPYCQGIVFALADLPA